MRAPRARALGAEEACRDLTSRGLRRLLESDLHLDAKTLDEAPWKAQVTAHLDEVSLRTVAAAGVCPQLGALNCGARQLS